MIIAPETRTPSDPAEPLSRHLIKQVPMPPEGKLEGIARRADMTHAIPRGQAGAARSG